MIDRRHRGRRRKSHSRPAVRHTSASDVFSDVLLIVLGVTTVLWGKWLLPRQLQNARSKMSKAGQEHFDDRLQRPLARRLFALTGVMGSLLIVIGVVFLLTE